MHTSRHIIQALGVVLAAIVLVGCENKPTPLVPEPVVNGVVIGLTDTPGEFATYQVDVTSLTLTEADGSVVQAIPVRTRVDFAQYANATEFLAALTLFQGHYSGAVMTLDYTNADIRVENGSGSIVPVTAVLDSQGTPVTTLNATVVISGDGTLTVVRGKSVNLIVDFDLKASNSVDLNGGSPIVTVQPVVAADAIPGEPKPFRLRGALDVVDLQGPGFQVDLRPFSRPLTGEEKRFGTMAVDTAADTLFDIDGLIYQGGSGLTQLATLNVLVPVIVFGGIDPVTQRLVAAQVLAGSSVPGDGTAAVIGTVVQRQGNVMTLRGATLTDSGGTVTFYALATVQLANSTVVRRQFDAASHTIGDISVGQRVTVLGTVTNPDPAGLAMDAGNGAVRLDYTTLSGTAVSLPTPFSLELHGIDGHDPSNFDFSGTGVDPAHDADAHNYIVDPNENRVGSIPLGAPVQVRGFVTPFGLAGGGTVADFSASQIIDLAQVPGWLVVNWQFASGTAITSVSSSGLTLDMTGTGHFHSLSRGGIIIDLTKTAAPNLIPAVNGLGLFQLHRGATDMAFTTFDRFITRLKVQLKNGRRVRSISARGLYADDTSTLTVDLIDVNLE